MKSDKAGHWRESEISGGRPDAVGRSGAETSTGLNGAGVVTLEAAETALRSAFERRSSHGPMAVAVADESGHVLACARTQDATPQQLRLAVDSAERHASAQSRSHAHRGNDGRVYARELPLLMTRSQGSAGAVAVACEGGDARSIVDDVVMSLLQATFRWLT